MTSPSGLFYAFAKNNRDDLTYRYLITFASQAVADEWWRAVTLSVEGGYTRFNHVVRWTHQFYSFNAALALIPDTLTDAKVVSGTNLLSKVFFTLINDRDGRIVPPAPVLNYTDLQSGKAFYIRSVLEPDIFWFYDRSEDVIVPSKDKRTKFTITVVDPDKKFGPKPIMIGTDRVTISVGQLNFYLRDKGIVGGNPLGDELLPTEFDFSYFDGGFEIKYSSGDDLQYSVIYPTSGKRGERWELV